MNNKKNKSNANKAFELESELEELRQRNASLDQLIYSVAPTSSLSSLSKNKKPKKPKISSSDSNGKSSKASSDSNGKSSKASSDSNGKSSKASSDSNGKSSKASSDSNGKSSKASSDSNGKSSKASSDSNGKSKAASSSGSGGKVIGNIQKVKSRTSSDRNSSDSNSSNSHSNNSNTRSTSTYFNNFIKDLKKLNIHYYSSVRMVQPADDFHFSYTPFYFLYIGIIFGLLDLIPLVVLNYNGTIFQKAALSKEFHTALISSVFICVPCLLNLIADNQSLRYFLEGNKQIAFEDDLQEWNHKSVEERKRLWISQAVFVVSVFIVDLYLLIENGQQNPNVPAVWVVSMMLVISSWYGNGIFILSSFCPQIFTVTRCSILLAVNSMSRLSRSFSYSYPAELALIVIDNAFVSIAYGGLIILSALACRVVIMKVYEAKDFSLLTPEDLVSSLYIFLGCATQIAASGVFAYFKTPTMEETGVAELCCYQFIVIVVVVLITILPARVSNLQTSHSLELISDFQQKKKQNVDLLNQILPPKVAYDIMVGSNFFPTQYDKIAVFFCDLERFAKQTSADSDPIDVVNFMNDLYLVMDHILSTTTNLYKLDMSSNIYICAGGILDAKYTPLENTCEVVDFALLVIETVRNLLVTIQKHPVELKIGIHMGKCLGAVVGSHLPKFVLMGNALNVSSALEYRGNFGKISVSATTAKLLLKTGFYEINEIPRKGDQNESVLVNTFEIVGPSAKHPKLTPEYFSSIKAESKKILDQAINQRSKLLKVKHPKKVENNIIQYYLDSKKNIRSAHY